MSKNQQAIKLWGKGEYWGICKILRYMEDWNLLMAWNIVLHKKRLKDSVEHDTQGNCTSIQKFVGEWNWRNWVSPNKVFKVYGISRDDKRGLQKGSHSEDTKGRGEQRHLQQVELTTTESHCFWETEREREVWNDSQNLWCPSVWQGTQEAHGEKMTTPTWSMSNVKRVGYTLMESFPRRWHVSGGKRKNSRDEKMKVLIQMYLIFKVLFLEQYVSPRTLVLPNK